MHAELNFDAPTTAGLTCPYCGEPAELEVEPFGLSHERFIEDCAVCCRPIVVEITRAADRPVGVVLLRDDD
jgi:Cysteine-rich CPXCG